MAVSVTNRKQSQSLQAESVTVKLNAADSAKLEDINIGMQATLSGNGKVGYVCRVDKYGHSFQINPEMPVTDLASDATPGYLNQGETITIQ